MADLNNLTKMTDRTAEFDQNDIQQNKVMAVLAYLSWLVLVPILAAKESKFARFHANQGLVLAIAEIVLGIVNGVISAILGALTAIPAIGVLFGILSVLVGIVFWVLGIVCFIFSILGIINAAQGQAKELPLIGKFTILK